MKTYEQDKSRIISRRAVLLGGGQVALLAALGARMYYLQVMEADKYSTLAEENRISVQVVPPPRGRMLDRFGRPIAVNRQNYQVLLVAERAKDVKQTLDTLARIIEVADGDRRKVLQELDRQREFIPVPIRDELSWQEVSRIEVNAPDLPGVMINVGQRRYYPHGEAMSNILGYVAAVSKRDRKKDEDPLLWVPGFRIGKAGMEGVHDKALRGTAGNRQVEVNALGRVIRELKRKEGKPGSEVMLTIDMELQKYAAKRMGKESGSVVVLDVETGEVLSMASVPGFDPHKLTDSEYWMALHRDPRAPLVNKCVAGQYSPGSTFKMVVALAGLEAGVISPDTRVTCRGHFTLGDTRFHCWKKRGHGRLDLKNGIKQSCDVYFYDVARRVGIDRIAKTAHKLGFGEEFGFELKEQTGLVPTRAWKKKARGVPWQLGETVVTGIGQGYLLCTPLQLAVMAARIANGRFALKPALTFAVRENGNLAVPEKSGVEPLNIAPGHLAVVADAMDAVVNEPGGTGVRSRLRKVDADMAGKTGTVQVRRISKEEREKGIRKNEELPWELRDHALFVGFAPVEKPKYAVAVVVEHGGAGSRAAGPVARDVLTKAIQLKSADPKRREGILAELAGEVS